MFRSFILNELNKLRKRKDDQVYPQKPTAAAPSVPQSNASIESIRDRLAKMQAKYGIDPR